MRNMSCMLTTPQVRDGFTWNGRHMHKTHSRRNGWDFLEPGDRVMLVEKGMGLRKGEHVVRLGPVEILTKDKEPLMDIVRYPVRESGIPEVVLEGFPQWVGQEDKFVKMYCDHNGNDPEDSINRLGWKYLINEPAQGRLIT